MKSKKKLKIKKAGYLYIFQVTNLIRVEEQEKIREKIKEQMNEGCVLIDGRAQLISVKPCYKSLGK